MNTRAPIRSICVAGAGIVGLSAARAFARALPGVAVKVIETPAHPGALTDRQPASLPTVHRFHHAIGLQEPELVADGVATHLLATRFENWSVTGAAWVHAFGDHGLPAGEVAFHALWAGQPDAPPFHAFAAGAVLAEANRFAHPSDDPDTPMGSFLYALRLDPAAYRARLARGAGVPIITATIADVEMRGNGGIAALSLSNGERVEADLFVDCTGPEAALLARTDAEFEHWREWFPFSAFTIDETPAQDPTPLDSVTADKDGWTWQSRLRGRTLIIRASRSGGIRIAPGRRPQPWRQNVLALGDAAVALDPLYGAGLHLAQQAILRALELLPGRNCDPLELAEYNRRTEQEVLRVRDALALHYLRSGRSDGGWAEAAQAEPPPGLARTLTQFERRGRLPFFEEESFSTDSWLAILSGLGVHAQQVDPAAAGVDPAKARAGMDAYAARLAALPGRFPPYPEWLDRFSRARPGAG